MKYERGDVVEMIDGSTETVTAVTDGGVIYTLSGKTCPESEIARHIHKLGDRELFDLMLEKTLDRIPLAFHKFVTDYSWREGHSNGYNEVILIAEDLVDGIAESLREYKP